MLVAWLLATGSHLDVVQTFAWSSMFAQNARVLPALDALELTFSPTEACGVCLAVQEAKHDRTDGATTSSSVEGKAPLVFQRYAGVVVTAPDGHSGVIVERALLEQERTAPPVPPPRAVG